jgi:hypothetical protein
MLMVMAMITILIDDPVLLILFDSCDTGTIGPVSSMPLIEALLIYQPRSMERFFPVFCYLRHFRILWQKMADIYGRSSLRGYYVRQEDQI